MLFLSLGKFNNLADNEKLVLKTLFNTLKSGFTLRDTTSEIYIISYQQKRLALCQMGTVL